MVMMSGYIFIDFDGVILDSNKRMLERKYDIGLYDHKNKTEFDIYFEYTNLHPEEWEYIIKGAKSINNSVEIIKELENLKRKIAILTKVHTLQEMKVKTEVLRENLKIFCPVIFVPSGVKKHQLVIPNHQLLVDDSNLFFNYIYELCFSSPYSWKDNNWKKENGEIDYTDSLGVFDLNRKKIVECLIKNHDYNEKSEVGEYRRNMAK